MIVSLQCDNYEKCTQCPEGLNRIIVDDKCTCDRGFSEDSNQLCQSCHYSCQTCFGIEFDKCLSCSDDSARSLVVAEEKQYCKKKKNAIGIEFIFNKKLFLNMLKMHQLAYDYCTSCSLSRKLEKSLCMCYLQSQFDGGQSLDCINCHQNMTCYGPGVSNRIQFKSNSNNPPYALIINRFLEFRLQICLKKWFDDYINEKCQVECSTSMMILLIQNVKNAINFVRSVAYLDIQFAQLIYKRSQDLNLSKRFNILLSCSNLLKLNLIQQKDYISILNTDVPIQYYKLSYAFIVSEELRLEPLNPPDITKRKFIN